jgi:putative PIG3 family NAD(P)H quinone oxidoreductase
MRALVIASFGAPDVLRVVDRPKPVPSGDEVLVRVRAAGVNRADLLQRAGHYPAPPDSPQDIPGMEYCGVVAGLGPDAHALKMGTRVFGIVGGGAQAEYLVAREALAMAVPDAVSDVEGGAIPEAYITAHDALYVVGSLEPGERVLVHAVGSGVGLAVLQLAKARGCTVFGTSRNKEKLEKAKAYGLDVAIDPSDGPFEQAARDIDVVVDFVGAPYFEANLSALAGRGRLIIVSTLGGTSAQLSLRTLMTKRLQIAGTVMRSRSFEEKVKATRAFESDVLGLLSDRYVHVPIDRVFKLEEAAEAHRYLEQNKNFGKVVFDVGDGRS